MCPFLSSKQSTMWTETLPILTTLIGAFLGVWFAFMLQNRREDKNEKNENVAALNKIQINFVQQLNALTIFNKDFILPYKDLPIYWIAVPAAPYRDYSKLQIDAGSLSFLINKDNSQLISEILVVEEQFQEVINLINLRSEVHVRQLQPKLEEIGFREGKPFDKSIEEVEELLGDRLVGELKRSTSGLISSTENAIKSHEEIIKKIKTTGSEIFPTKRIISFEYLNIEK